jgi:hypothetical protein
MVHRISAGSGVLRLLELRRRALGGELVNTICNLSFYRHDAEDPQLRSLVGYVSVRIRVEQRRRTGGGNPAGLFFYFRLHVNTRT